MTTKGEILDFLSGNKKHFRKRYGIIKIGLFGSFARDEQTESSDIDLIVEFKKNTPNLYDLKIDLKRFIKENLNLDVDIAREKYIKPNYRKSIHKETIYVD